MLESDSVKDLVKFCLDEPYGLDLKTLELALELTDLADYEDEIIDRC